MDELLISFGGGVEIKSVGEGLSELRGPAIIFDPHTGGAADLVGEYFSADSYYGPLVAPGKTAEFEATFNHGIPTHEGLKALADYEFKNPVKTEVTEAGVIASLLLDEREEYEKVLADFARKNPGKLGWSSATALHRAKREKKSDGRTWIKRWPIVEIAVTHKPCEPRTSATLPLKSLAEAAKTVDGEALFNDSLRQTEQQTWELWSAVQTGARKIVDAALSSDITGVEVNVREAVTALVGAYSPKLIEAIILQITEYLTSENRTDNFYLKSSLLDEFIASSEGLVSDSTLEDHSLRVVSAVEEFAQKTALLSTPLKAWIVRVKEKQEFRASDPLKSGRVISAANKEKVSTVRARVSELRNMLKEMEDSLSELETMAEPKKSADPDVVRGLMASFEFMRRRTATARSN